MTSYSGYILSSHEARKFEAAEFELLESEISQGPTLVHKHDRTFGIKSWDEYRLTSFTPLADEPDEQKKPFEYAVFIVRGFSTIIVLATRRNIVDFALRTIIDKRIYPNLRKVSVFIDQMIEYCGKPESEFLITSLHGKFSGSNNDLRRMSLYGDDVTQSAIYSGNNKLFNFTSCGVGRRSIDGVPNLQAVYDGEIIRLGSDGYVNVMLNTRTQAVESMKVIAFLLENRWVEDWVIVGKEGLLG